MSRKKISSKYSDKELAEALIFRNTISPKQKEKEKNEISAARKKLKLSSRKDISLKFKLLQLKYQMEDSIIKPFDKNSTFGSFLRSYIDTLNVKQYQLAEDISIDKTYLSQLINQRRTPSEEVMIRLELHSQNLISAVIWFKLSEKVKEYELTTNKAIRKKEKKFVKSIVG